MNSVRHRSVTPRESGRDELDRLRRQVRRLSERNAMTFDQGFQAAVTMVAAGADLEQLRAASGIVAADHDDTDPIDIREALGLDETDVHVIDPFEVDTLVGIPELIES